MAASCFRHFAQYDFTDKSVDWCLRLSTHYYNTTEEIDLVASAVADLTS